MIDSIQTLLDQVRTDAAKGRILNSDLTTSDCWIAKVEGHFAHGATLKDAFRDAIKKAMDNMPIDRKIEMFRKEFPSNDAKYPASAFFEWHATLTGSCEMGRRSFMENKGLTMEMSFTVPEFVELVKNSYGGDIVSRILS